MPFSIEAQKRPEGSKPNALRRGGKIPATLYGHSGAESIHLVVDGKAAEFLVRDAAANKSIVELNIPELSWNGKTVMREIQKHPWKGSLYHISFFAQNG